MTEHTPGPWRLMQHKPNLFSIIARGTNPNMEDGENVIAEVQPAYLPLSALHPDEIEANARLIAAAPKLLEALKLFIRVHACGGFVEPDDDVIEQAKQAIRHAEEQA